MSTKLTEPQRRYLELIAKDQPLPAARTRGAKGARSMMIDRLEGFGWIERNYMARSGWDLKERNYMARSGWDLTERGLNALEGRLPT